MIEINQKYIILNKTFKESTNSVEDQKSTFASWFSLTLVGLVKHPLNVFDRTETYTEENKVWNYTAIGNLNLFLSVYKRYYFRKNENYVSYFLSLRNRARESSRFFLFSLIDI